jgi:hypothetical protein
MSPAADSSQRLQRLAEILAESTAVPSTSKQDPDPVDAHLESVPLERIRRLTSELTPRAATAIDEIDELTMRLLLNEYAAAVAHLREVVRLAEQPIAAATGPIQEAKLHARQQQKWAEARRKKQERAPTTPHT